MDRGGTFLRLAGDRDLALAFGEPDAPYEGEVDCRLFFAGSNLPAIRHAFEEAVRCFRGVPAGELSATLSSSERVSRYYDVRGLGEDVEIILKDEVFRRSGRLADGAIGLGSGHGQRFSVPVERLPALGALSTLLGGQLGYAEIEHELVERLTVEEGAWAVSCLRWLETQDLVVRIGSPRAGPQLRPGAPRLTFLGHSGLLFSSRGTTLAVDPVLRTGLGSPVDVREVARLPLGAICCSHSHWDHCDPQTLLLFDKRVPVIVPRVEDPTIFNPPIVPVLRLLGFTDVRELSAWETTRVEDVEVVAVPFHGEQDEPGERIDHFTYVLRTDGLTVYGGVDSYRDTFGEMGPVLERVGKEFRPDIALLPVSRLIYRFETGGVNGFCRTMRKDLLGQSFEYTAGPAEAAASLGALGSRVFVPYADFAFSRWRSLVLERELRAALREAGQAAKLCPLRPMDAIGPAEVKAFSHWSSYVRVARLRAADQAARIGRQIARLEPRRVARALARRIARLFQGA